MSSHSHLSFAFGVLGNISSFFCFLAPLPTFYRICKKKSTEGFQSIPYVAALFSAMLWIFYAYVKTGETLLITINAFGCVIETIYLAIYVAYCPKKARMSTLIMIVLINFGGFGSILVLTHVLAKGESRFKLLGWICVVFATSVFAAPLSIIRVVIRTKSVEFLPFPLSFLLLISAVIWLLYGISLKDIYVAIPNVVGLVFGIVQITLYAIYRNSTPVQDEKKLPEHKGDIIISNNEIEIVFPSKIIDEKKQEESIEIEIEEKKEEKQDEQQQHDEQVLGEEKTAVKENEKENIINMMKTEERQSSCELRRSMKKQIVGVISIV